MQNSASLRERLVFRRNRLNMTQTDLARESGVSARSISDYENGKSDPGLEHLQKISTALGVTVGWLIGENEHLGTTKPSAWQERPEGQEAEDILAALDRAQEEIQSAKRLAERLKSAAGSKPSSALERATEILVGKKPA